MVLVHDQNGVGNRVVMERCEVSSTRVEYLLFVYLFSYIQVDPRRLENLLDIEKVKWIKCTYKYNWHLRKDYTEYVTTICMK